MPSSVKKPRLSLCLIVAPRDSEATQLERALANTSKHVDEICVTITGDNKAVEDVCNKYKAKVSHIEWHKDFSEARNFNFKQASGEWIVWMDADDTFTKPEMLRKLVDHASKNKIDGYWLLYAYNFDKNGNCIDQHWKAQLLKNDGHFEWKGKIHEDPLQQRAARWVKSTDTLRVHHSHETPEREVESAARNLEILQAESERDPNEPRTWFYLGRAYISLNKLQEAIDCLQKYLTLSGWDQERYEARLLIGQCFFVNKQYDEALVEYNNAILEREDYPDAYIQKGMTYLKKEKWHSAIENFLIAQAKRPSDTMTYMNPMLYKRDVYSALATCYLYSGLFSDAMRNLNIALQADPKNKYNLELRDIIASTEQKFETAKSFVKIATYLEQKGQASKMLPLLAATPSDLIDNPLLVKLQSDYMKPEKWPKHSLAVYCGNTVEPWTGKNLDTGGIGGSETAVVELCERLAKKGWDIVVYNNCQSQPEGVVEKGVRYKNYWSFNWKEEFDVLWVWRMPELFELPLKARVRILDLHDVPNPLEFTPERLERMDKIFVKTKYHRSLLPNIPDDKFVIVGNGINLDRFDSVEERDPVRFAYSSTPNRGLDILLGGIWQKIKEKYTNATLHTYYGWNTFEALEKNNPERMAWMKKMKKLMEETPGVVNHGRVGQQELARDMLRTSFWLYPTYFPEIHCCTGDTLIEMPRDHKKYPLGVPIKDLVGKTDFPVYSYDKESDKLVLGTVKWVAKTRKNAEIWRLTLDDGTYLEATSDHKIMLRDGSYKELHLLSAGESLMPVYMRANFMVKNNNGSWEDEHRLVGEWKTGRKLLKSEHVNHLDDTRFDNTPEMLEVLTASEHHSKTFTGRKKSRQSVEKRMKGWKTWSESEKGKSYHSSNGVRRANKFWQVIFPSWTKEKQDEFLRRRVESRMYNHKVVRVENTGRKEDVYDMEVDKYHNFGANGIIVHNCITACEYQAAGVVPITSGYAALAETQVAGIKLEGDVYDPKWQEEYASKVIDAVEAKWDREHIQKQAEQFSWDLVADVWDAKLQ